MTSAGEADPEFTSSLPTEMVVTRGQLLLMAEAMVWTSAGMDVIEKMPRKRWMVPWVAAITLAIWLQSVP